MYIISIIIKRLSCKLDSMNSNVVVFSEFTRTIVRFNSNIFWMEQSNQFKLLYALKIVKSPNFQMETINKFRNYIWFCLIQNNSSNPSAKEGDSFIWLMHHAPAMLTEVSIIIFRKSALRRYWTLDVNATQQR